MAVLKPFVVARGREVAVVSTWSATGAIKPHIVPMLRALKAEGVAVLLVAASAWPLLPSGLLLDLVDGAFVRGNSGAHFAAWGHAAKFHPELFGASTLYLITDDLMPVSGGRGLAEMLARVRSSAADLLGLTESLRGGWHLQEGFLALRPRLLSSFALQAYFAQVRLLPDADAERDAYALRFAGEMAAAGFTTDVLFPSHQIDDPVAAGWRGLVAAGLPLLASRALPNSAEDRERLRLAGYDLDILDALRETLRDRPADDMPHDDRLVLRAVSRPGERASPLKVSLFGPWNLADDAGAWCRDMLVALRRAGVRLNLYPIRVAAGASPIAPAADILDFEGGADLAIVALSPDRWDLLTEDQRRLTGDAHRRIGCWQEGGGVAYPAAEDRMAVRRIWVADEASAAALRSRVQDIAIDVIGRLTSAIGTDQVVAGIAQAVAASLDTAMGDHPIDPKPHPIDLRLTGGVPIAEARPPAHLHIVVLGSDGALPAAGVAIADLPTGREQWILFAPAATWLAPDLAERIDRARARRPDAAIFYGDDVACETPYPVDQLRLKPEFDLTLLCAQDYIGAPVIVRGDRLAEIGGLRTDRGTAVMIDLLFRAHAAGHAIARIPEVLLAHAGARIMATPDDHRATLAAQPQLAGLTFAPGLTPATTQVLRHFSDAAAPAVTLVIPTRGSAMLDGTRYIDRLLAGIARTAWPMDRLTVLVGDDSPEAAEWASQAWPFALRRIATPRGPGVPFNYAEKMNRLWRETATEQIVFLNDDVRPRDGDWLAALQGFATDPGVGGVGARLVFPDGGLQHAGVAPHLNGASHLWIGRQERRGTYQDWALVQREWSMVTGAVFATRRSLMERVDGFDERFSVEFNDVDLCLRLRMLGLRIVYTPFAELEHVEKASRGHDLPMGDEVAAFVKRWRNWLDDDPSWHPRLDRNRLEMGPAAVGDAWYR